MVPLVFDAILKLSRKWIQLSPLVKKKEKKKKKKKEEKWRQETEGIEQEHLLLFPLLDYKRASDHTNIHI